MIRSIFFCLVFFSLQAVAQKKIASLEIADEIVFATIDRVGEVYVVTRVGHIQKFDINGKLIASYNVACFQPHYNKSTKTPPLRLEMSPRVLNC